MYIENNILTASDDGTLRFGLNWFLDLVVNLVFVSWYSNSSRGGQIRLSGIQICLSLKLIALDSIVGKCC